MSHDEFKEKRWRRWQFRLRILMLLMLVVAAFFGGWAANDWNRKKVLRQRRNQLQPLTTPFSTPLTESSFQEAEFFKEFQKSRAERVQEREPLDRKLRRTLAHDLRDSVDSLFDTQS